jgi:hypothetical protein
MSFMHQHDAVTFRLRSAAWLDDDKVFKMWQVAVVSQCELLTQTWAWAVMEKATQNPSHGSGPSMIRAFAQYDTWVTAALTLVIPGYICKVGLMVCRGLRPRKQNIWIVASSERGNMYSAFGKSESFRWSVLFFFHCIQLLNRKLIY